MKEKELTGLEAALYTVIKKAVFDGTREALALSFPAGITTGNNLPAEDQKTIQTEKVEPVATAEKPQTSEVVAQDTQEQPKKRAKENAAPVIADEDLPTTGAPLPEQKKVENVEDVKPANDPIAETTAKDFDDVEDVEEIPLDYQKDVAPLCKKVAMMPGGVNEFQRLLKLYGVENLKYTTPNRLRDLKADLEAFMKKKAA